MVLLLSTLMISAPPFCRSRRAFAPSSFPSRDAKGAAFAGEGRHGSTNPSLGRVLPKAASGADSSAIFSVPDPFPEHRVLDNIARADVL
jgi:hypothetical protein